MKCFPIKKDMAAVAASRLADFFVHSLAESVQTDPW